MLKQVQHDARLTAGQPRLCSRDCNAKFAKWFSARLARGRIFLLTDNHTHCKLDKTDKHRARKNFSRDRGQVKTSFGTSESATEMVSEARI
jgi:hypothetical protein